MKEEAQNTPPPQGSRSLMSRLPPRARDLLFLTLAAFAGFSYVAYMGAAGVEHVVLAILLFGLFAVGLYFEEEVRGWRTRPRLTVGAISSALQGPLSAATAAAAFERLPDPFLLLDRAGRIVLANKASMQAFGGASDRRHIASVIRFPAVLEAIERVLAGGQPEDVEYSYLVPVERHFSAHVRPVPGEPPNETWVLIILRDLTAMKRVDQMRADFVANASHELRTPLASVAGFIETLRGHAREDPAAREKFLEIMHDQTVRMRRLIDDLLSLSRIELNEHVPPSGEVDVLAVLRDVKDALTPLAASQRVQVVLDCPDALPLVRGERDELVQVFQNLIDNAIKYGKPAGNVTISAQVIPPSGRRTVPTLSIAVRDEGEGIAREHLPRLTERFYRVDVKSSRERGGTGLGLAIVKHILVRHQGTLGVESKVGEGSTFTVLLPAIDHLAPTAINDQGTSGKEVPVTKASKIPMAGD